MKVDVAEPRRAVQHVGTSKQVSEFENNVLDWISRLRIRKFFAGQEDEAEYGLAVRFISNSTGEKGLGKCPSVVIVVERPERLH
jgi:hypothetical protein